ncbi:TPA: hypothetical protein L9M27_002006 [Klebsiella pneumoniae]|nr:hypothetical protein [Klebsiella pneumoniae]
MIQLVKVKMEIFLNFINQWVKPLQPVGVIISLIVAFFAIRTHRKKYQEIEKKKISKFPPEKMRAPYFRLENTDPKSIDQFIGFFDKIDNEIIELDVVVCEDSNGFIDVSKEYMEKYHKLASDYLTIWKPFRLLSDDEKAGASNSEGFALKIIYTQESDASLSYRHGYWYLKGFFTVLSGDTSNGVCCIPIRAEKVQRRI